jgi:hypothetical protein
VWIRSEKTLLLNGPDSFTDAAFPADSRGAVKKNNIIDSRADRNILIFNYRHIQIYLFLFFKKHAIHGFPR